VWVNGVVQGPGIMPAPVSRRQRITPAP
jgi:hypothetical protein